MLQSWLTISEEWAPSFGNPFLFSLQPLNPTSSPISPSWTGLSPIDRSVSTELFWIYWSHPTSQGQDVALAGSWESRHQMLSWACISPGVLWSEELFHQKMAIVTWARPQQSQGEDTWGLLPSLPSPIFLFQLLPNLFPTSKQVHIVN